MHCELKETASCETATKNGNSSDNIADVVNFPKALKLRVRENISIESPPEDILHSSISAEHIKIHKKQTPAASSFQCCSSVLREIVN